MACPAETKPLIRRLGRHFFCQRKKDATQLPHLRTICPHRGQASQYRHQLSFNNGQVTPKCNAFAQRSIRLDGTKS